MLDTNSRYSSQEEATFKLPDGRVAIYKRRRFLPQAEQLQVLAEITIVEGDRLDLLTARTLGDAEQFWRVCDANRVMNPFDLLEEPGTVVRIAVPQL
ncbi:MAG TPA: hypothetical protein VGX50_06605 [Longimicrobium sp.]|jgi:hypothetical protein|nr:hypothetical protein [Longimicrobium sp.]